MGRPRHRRRVPGLTVPAVRTVLGDVAAAELGVWDARLADEVARARHELAPGMSSHTQMAHEMRIMTEW